MVTKLSFSFYYSKDQSVFKVIIDDYDTLKISDFLYKAIKEYNEQNENQIVDEIQYYKIKLAKKSGKPETDLPAISADLVVKESNWTEFSIALDKDHYIDGPPATTQTTNKNNNEKSNKENLLITDSKKHSKTENSVEIQENQGGLCCCLTALFRKKK